MHHTYFLPECRKKAPGTKAPAHELLLMLNAGLPATEKAAIFKIKLQTQSQHNAASMRAFVVEAKPQQKRRRRAWPC